MATKKIKYILIQDNDSHWYVIPSSKETEWWEYLRRVDEATENCNVDYPNEPKWVEPVGGAPSLVEFTEYKIR